MAIPKKFEETYAITKNHNVATEIDIECSACLKLQPLASNCCKCGEKLDQIFIPKDLVCYYTKDIDR